MSENRRDEVTYEVRVGKIERDSLRCYVELLLCLHRGQITIYPHVYIKGGMLVFLFDYATLGKGRSNKTA